MLFNWAMLGIMLAAAVVSATVVLAVSAAPAEILDVLSAPQFAANLGNIAHAMLDMMDKAAHAVDAVHDGVEKAWNMMATKFSPFMICGPITFLYHEVRCQHTTHTMSHMNIDMSYATPVCIHMVHACANLPSRAPRVSVSMRSSSPCGVGICSHTREAFVQQVLQCAHVHVHVTDI